MKQLHISELKFGFSTYPIMTEDLVHSKVYTVRIGFLLFFKASSP